MTARASLPGRMTELIVLLTGVLALTISFALAGVSPEGSAVGWWAVGAYFAAVMATRVYWHPYRVAGFVPLAAGCWLLVACYGLATGHWIGWLLGLTAGAAIGPLGGRVPAGPVWVQLLAAVGVVGIALFAGSLLLPVPDWAPWLLVGSVALLTVLSWGYFIRPFLELCVEPPLWLMYRIRGTGPGLRDFPVSGPCLVIANHACWFDPLFLAKVLPRPVTPMMTARFYDLPGLRWVLRRVFQTIRVPEKALKQDVPQEIQEAIAALDRGACVVIFPEGYLRRTDEKPLKRFGRGVWQILQARPDTPVFACWIEGGWRSYASYYNGRPTKNKRPDFRRPIGVSVTGPVAIDPETREQHLLTRIHLMNLVVEARKHLALPDLPAFELPTQEEKDDDGS